ncbi:MAG: hypothetical protein JW757_00630 [Anaerolineales bacterium]|nr:hypothetical protein [Anaerolineales bacterium]
MNGAEKYKLDKIVKLLEGGQEQKAYGLLKDLLIQNPDHLDAWVTMLKISPNEKERAFANERIRQLSPREKDQSSEKLKSKREASANPPKTAPGWEEREIQLAMKLNADGKTKLARRIVDEVLRKAPKFPPAIYASGLLSETVMDYRNALAELADLGKQDRDAKSYYQELVDLKFKENRGISWKPMWIITVGASLFLVLVGMAIAAPLLGFSIGKNNENRDSAGILEEVAEADELTCEELIANALDVSDQRCRQIGSNQVCYGNFQLIAEYDGPVDAFDAAGDVLGIEAIHTLKASPLDVLKELWGVAVFKLKANMAGTIPGQNVTFLVFGNTDINNASGDMTAFYFSTGFGGITCNGVSFDGLQIIADDGAGFVFTANDVQISLFGDAIMVAQPGGMMDITLANGSAQVTSSGVTQILEPGTSVSIPMDENLSASGPPSEVTAASGGQASLLCQLFGVNCPEGEISFILGEVTPTVDGTEAAVATPFETSVGSVVSNTLTPETIPVPTNTPVAVCSQISARFTAYGKFQITNNSGTPVVLTSMTLSWPTINGRWNKVYLGGLIGSPNAESPPATHVFYGHLSLRTLQPGDSKAVRLEFEEGVKGGPYSATFYFDNGCSSFARN